MGAHVIAGLRDFANRVLGRGDAAITVPTFDGALKPNQLLEQAEIVAEFAQAEDLAAAGETLYVADGSAVLRREGAETREVRAFDRPVTALCEIGRAHV